MLTISKPRALKMSIFNKIDYRLNLKSIVENRKKIDSSVTYQAMAEYMRIQKAYLSQVIKGHRELSQDQLYLAMDYLDLKDHEKQFMSLCLEFERSGLSVRKKEIKKLITALQKEYSRTGAHIEVVEVEHNQNVLDAYYLDPWNLIIQICLWIPSFNQDASKISTALNLPVNKVESVFRQLEKVGVISVENGKVKVNKNNMHIPKESPIFQMWRQQLNLIAQNRVQMVSDDKKYNFQVVFSADENARKFIHNEFLKLLKKVQKTVGDSKNHDVYQMNFDLFSWTN